MGKRTKVIKRAQKYIKQGRVESAVTVYKKLIEENPRDWGLINMVGDLYASMGKTEAAIDYFERIADHYAKDGFFLKAIAIYKKITKLKPESPDVYVRLAKLYDMKELPMETKMNYLEGAKLYLRKAQAGKAREIYELLIKLEPENYKFRLNLAELFLQQGEHSRAVDEFRILASKMMVAGNIAEAKEVLERIYRMEPENPEIVSSMADIYCQEENVDKAVETLERMLQSHPDNTLLLNKMGELFIKDSRFNEAAEKLRTVLYLEPENLLAKFNLGLISLEKGELEEAYQLMEPLIDYNLTQKREKEAVTQLNAFLNRDPSYTEALEKLAKVYTSLSNLAELTAVLNKLVDIYLQKGLHIKGIKVLERLVDLDPENVEYDRKLRHLQLQLSPEEQKAIPPAEAPVKEEKAEIAPEELPKQEEMPQRVEGVKSLGDALTEVEIFVKFGLHDRALERLEEILPLYSQNVELHESLKSVYLQKKQYEKAAHEYSILVELCNKRGRKEQAERFTDEAVREIPNQYLDPSVFPVSGVEEAAVIEELEEDRERLPFIEELGEIESLGELSPPTWIEEKAPPPEPEVVEKEEYEIELPGGELEQEEIEKQPSPSETMAEDETATEAEKEPLDLEEELIHQDEVSPIEEEYPEPGQELLEQLPFSPEELTAKDETKTIDEDKRETLQEILQGIKENISKVVGDEDYETRYNLGIAYKEMKLIDEAITEFNISLNSPRRRLQSCTMLGICFMEKGDYAKAVEWFEKGLELVDTDEQKEGLIFYLGQGYEQLGNNEEALEKYQLLYKMNKHFPGLVKKIKELEKAAP
ncbi:MAG: tetratricopeptide repeat protein [Candidatus Aminicenantes bacterium]|nr:tetratricopeptide repeat protein [Candidatus Aminicenantes bacterium]